MNRMTDRELLELIAAQVGALTQNVSELKEGQNTLTQDVSELKEGQKKVENEVRKTNVTIENDIKPKVTALFDGYTQTNNKLDRIEKEVSRHEEVIIRKIK